MILNCSCVHAWQDAKHGAGRRVHTPASGKGKNGGGGGSEWYCTVCNTKKSPSKKAVVVATAKDSKK
jgi:hypothetical protein